MRPRPKNSSLPCRGHALIALLFFSLLVVFPKPARAQGRSGSVSVRVGDAEDEAPIRHADVRLYVFSDGNFSYQSYADAGGRVTFGVVSVGKYAVAASARGYESGQQDVDVVSGQASYTMLHLRREGTAPRPKPGAAVSTASLRVPDDARKEYETGNASLATDPSSSIPHFRKAVTICPKYAEAYLMLAVAYLRLNQRPDAMKAIERAIGEDPSFSKTYTLRGRMLLEDREFGGAEEALKESLRLDPQSWDAHFELARCYYNMGKMTDALKEAQQARDLPQANAATHLLLADIHLEPEPEKRSLG